MKIIYFGPITPKGKISMGGFESINRKIVDKLIDCGVEIEEMSNPRIKHSKYGMWKIKYLLLLLYPFSLLKYVGRKDVLIHITPIDRLLLYPSSYIVFFAKILRIPILVDLHAGSFFYYYDTRSSLYRKAARSMLLNANAITIEGRAYKKQLLERINYKGEIMYFPNMAVCFNDRHDIRNDGKYGLFYFGRITVGKGVDIMLRLSEIMGDKFHLFLDGSISDGLDLKKVDKTKVTYLGIHTMSEIREIMKGMTFFLFPSRHLGEGQSNSLIEAMEAGLIPISSNQGFSEDVVADCGVVLDKNASAEDYLKALLQLCTQDLQDLSARCQDHIRKNHNLDIGIPRLIRLYERILTPKR